MREGITPPIALGSFELLPVSFSSRSSTVIVYCDVLFVKRGTFSKGFEMKEMTGLSLVLMCLVLMCLVLGCSEGAYADDWDFAPFYGSRGTSGFTLGKVLDGGQSEAGFMAMGGDSLSDYDFALGGFWATMFDLPAVKSLLPGKDAQTALGFYGLYDTGIKEVRSGPFVLALINPSERHSWGVGARYNLILGGGADEGSIGEGGELYFVYKFRFKDGK